MTKLQSLSLLKTDGTALNLPEDLTKKTIFYFYPKDDTPGCTIQACSYRDNIDAFKQHGIDVYGVSADGVESHKAFTEKFNLNFPLLVDTDKKLAAMLGVSGRDSFLVDKAGVVIKEWKNVKPNLTVNETLEAAQNS